MTIHIVFFPEEIGGKKLINHSSLIWSSASAIQRKKKVSADRINQNE